MGISMQDIEDCQIDAVVEAAVRNDNLTEVNAKTLTSLLTSLARMKYNRKNTVDKSLSHFSLFLKCPGDRLAKKAVMLRKFMLSQELSNTLWSLGVLGIKDSSILKALAYEVLHPRILSALTPQALSNILLSCARMNFRYRPFLEPLMEEITRSYRLRAYEEQHLGNLIWAIGRLWCGQESQHRALAQECITSQRLNRFTPLHVCNIFSG